jgi:hypothetical protein
MGGSYPLWVQHRPSADPPRSQPHLRRRWPIATPGAPPRPGLPAARQAPTSQAPASGAPARQARRCREPGRPPPARVSSRSASAKGRNGLPPASGRARPVTATTPALTACSCRWSASRVFPTPASPTTTSAPPRASARSRRTAGPMSDTGSSRPTMIGQRTHPLCSYSAAVRGWCVLVAGAYSSRAASPGIRGKRSRLPRPGHGRPKYSSTPVRSTALAGSSAVSPK